MVTRAGHVANVCDKTIPRPLLRLLYNCPGATHPGDRPTEYIVFVYRITENKCLLLQFHFDTSQDEEIHSLQPTWNICQHRTVDTSWSPTTRCRCTNTHLLTFNLYLYVGTRSMHLKDRCLLSQFTLYLLLCSDGYNKYVNVSILKVSNAQYVQIVIKLRISKQVYSAIMPS